MTKPVWEYSDEAWEALDDREKAKSIKMLEESLKIALERINPYEFLAEEKCESLKSSLLAAIRARLEYLGKG